MVFEQVRNKMSEFPFMESSAMVQALKQRQPGSTIYDRNIQRPRGLVSASSFAYIFGEMIQYHQRRVHSITGLEKKLEESGYGVGLRMFELIGCRERLAKRETKIVNILQFITNKVWQHLFNKTADNLERSMENEDEYMIHEQLPITNTFTKIPEDMGSFTTASFIAGIIAGILESSGFKAKVTAHKVDGEEEEMEKTVYLCKFDEQVMVREKQMA